MPLVPLCNVEDVPEGEARKIELDDLVLAIFHVGDHFYIANDLCTHGPGSLSEGFLEGETVECNFHQGKFNVRTGEVEHPPCTIPLKTYETVIEGGMVFLKL